MITRRLFSALMVALVGATFLPSATPIRAADAPRFDQVLPDDTIGLLSIRNAAELRREWSRSQFGRLMAEPGVQAFIDDLLKKDEVAEVLGKIEKELGIGLGDLLRLPEGQVALGVRAKPGEGAEPDVSVMAVVDFGGNLTKGRGLVDRLVQKAEQQGAVKKTETFEGTAITVLKRTGKKDDDGANGNGEKGKSPADRFSLAYGIKDSSLFAASDEKTLKQMLTNAKGGGGKSLAQNESYQHLLKRVGADAHIHFFVDAGQIVNLVSGLAGDPSQAAQVGVFMQLLGLAQIKSIGGSYAMGSGAYDGVMKLFVHHEGPAQGALKIFALRTGEIKPESWVPGDVASYMSVNWDLKEGFDALNQLVNTFQPGALEMLLEKALGPEGQKVDLQKDVVNRLGKRVTMVTDYSRPITANSQRMLIAIELSDEKGFAQTLSKLAGLLPAGLDKREFQGHLIYEAKAPQAGAGGDDEKAVTMGLTVAKNRLMFATNVGLLEKVLREDSGKKLSDSLDYQAVAEHFPGQAVTMSFSRNEEQMRYFYDLLKSGALAQQLGAAAALEPRVGFLAELLNGEKLPEFDTIRRYLSPSGGYTTIGEDGLLNVSFTLRKENP